MIGRLFGRAAKSSGDRYASFTELARREREGRDYVRTILDRESAIAIVAPHGGGLEAGTSEIATAIAGRDLSLYSFEGIKLKGNESLHVTSIHFDDPACLELLARARSAVTIHGFSGTDMGIRVGGLDGELRAAMIPALIDAGFIPLADDTVFTGMDPRNICNRTATGKGLQMELSRGLRSAMFLGLQRAERSETTPLFRRLVLAVRGVLLSTGPT